MTPDNRNIILAVVLSAVVLLGWQYFIARPQMERARQQTELAQQTGEPGLATPGSTVTTPAGPDSFETREAALQSSARVRIETNGPWPARSISPVGASMTCSSSGTARRWTRKARS